MLIKQGEKLINTRNWSELVKPEQMVRDSEPGNTMYGKFMCEPLERGYGNTIGNALRRVLLASLQGAAFVSAKISGVQHEFTTIPGVLEDVTDIILNIKQVRLAMDTDEAQRLELTVNKKARPQPRISGPTRMCRCSNPSSTPPRLPKMWSSALSWKRAWAKVMCRPTCTRGCRTKSA